MEQEQKLILHCPKYFRIKEEMGKKKKAAQMLLGRKYNNLV